MTKEQLEITDTERLEWIQNNAVTIRADKTFNLDAFTVSDSNRTIYARTLREAIDAHIREEKVSG